MASFRLYRVRRHSWLQRKYYQLALPVRSSLLLLNQRLILAQLFLRMISSGVGQEIMNGDLFDQSYIEKHSCIIVEASDFLNRLQFLDLLTVTVGLCFVSFAMLYILRGLHSQYRSIVERESGLEESAR